MSPFMKLFIVVCISLFTAQVNAVDLLIEDGLLVGAQNIDVNGELYDVHFVDGTCAEVYGDGITCDPSTFPFSTKSESDAAVNALLNQVFVPPFDYYDEHPEDIRGCGGSALPYGYNCAIHLAYDVDPGLVVISHVTNFAESSGYNDRASSAIGTSRRYLPADWSQQSQIVWSTWTESAPAVFVLASSGTFECDDIDQASVPASATIYDDPTDPFTTLEWYLDDTPVGTVLVGEILDIDVPLGDHLLKVIGTTSLGVTDEHEAIVSVVDTIGPSIQASLDEGRKKNEVLVSIDATDTCDANPLVDATAGIPVLDGQVIKVAKKSNELILRSDGLSLVVVATDASGNTTVEEVDLQ